MSSNQHSFSESYKAAGVDITAGYEAVSRMRAHIDRTMIPGVLSPIGGFGGLFSPDISGMREPVLVSGTDGVGTKLKLAFLMDKHDTVGVDCVAMCVNDIICCGAKPLFFLDYIAVGRNVPARVEAIVAGVAQGCVEAGCALIGGETAEMPRFYPAEEYDLAGFSVGMADKQKLLDPSRVRPGDAIIALPSSGAHSNGYSLIRRVFELENRPLTLTTYHDELGQTLGEALLAPTKIYVQPVLKLINAVSVHAVAHITGGGFYENIPRCLPAGLGARIEKRALQTPPLFGLIQHAGNIPERDMFNTFNMGVGLCVVVAAQEADAALELLHQENIAAYFMGEILPQDEGIVIC